MWRNRYFIHTIDPKKQSVYSSASNSIKTYGDFDEFQKGINYHQNIGIIGYGAKINDKLIYTTKANAKDLVKAYQRNTVETFYSLYKIMSQYGYSPDNAFRYSHQPYKEFSIYGDKSTTPYRDVSLLCDNWLEIYPEMDKKYPHNGMHEACRYYTVQEDLRKYYKIITGDKYETDYNDPQITQKTNKHWKAILKFALQNESEVIQKLTGSIPTLKILDYATGEIQLDIYGEPVEEETDKKKPPQNMRYQKIDPEYIQQCLDNIEKNKLPEYMPVRECTAQIPQHQKRAFLQNLIRLSKTQEATTTDKINTERIIRVAQNILNEINNNIQLELF